MSTNHALNLRVRVRPYLADLKARTKTNREVAKILNCNEQTLCRVLAGLGVEKEPAIDRKAISDLNQQRRAYRIKVANDPSLTPEQAAQLADVSVRTIYRYIGKTK